MPKIPTYSRRPSESAAVGTPGVDLSGAKIAEAVGGVADAALQAKIKKNQIVDNTTASRRLVDFDLESEQISQTVQQELSGKSPDEVRDEVKRRLTQRMGELGKDINSPDAKRDLNNAAYKIVGTRTLKAYQAANKLQSAKAGENVVSSLNTLSNSVSSVFSDKSLSLEEKMNIFNEKISLGGQVLDASSLVFNPQEYKKLRDNLPKMLAKGAVIGSIQSDPDLAISLLNSGEFDDSLSAEEKLTLTKKANDIKARMKTAQESAEKEAKQKNLMQTAQDFLDGNLTLDKLEELSTSGSITPQAAGAFELALFNPKQWQATEKDPKRWPTDKGRFLINTLESINENPEKIGEIVLRAVNEYNSGGIEADDLPWVINIAQQKLRNPTDSSLDNLSNALKMVANFSGPAAVPKLIAQLVEGEDPRETATRVIKHQARARNPKLAMMDEVPNSVMDAFGLIKKMWLGEEVAVAQPDTNSSQDYASREE